MPISPAQKKTVLSIIRSFETGRAEGRYEALAVLSDGAGFSYGLMQATDGGGSLDEIAIRYAAAAGACSKIVDQHLQALAMNQTRQLAPWVEKTATYPTTWPGWARQLADALRKAGADPIMQKIQDGVFDELYWKPCETQCEEMKLSSPLSWAIVFDTCIQSGPSRVWTMRSLFPQSPPSRGGNEEIWASQYVKARRNWLLDPAKGTAVNKTTYRMDLFDQLISAKNFSLTLPIEIKIPRVTIR